ncbi:hypothetical protein JOF56_001287 [Kibdelosporangium banguiense]|uniref:Uncharacterized protein n=1 Tax=Kibdelosporangium banguiense TaxID=1365924 RepID=A0ABS4T915_9PSEU|nr:hypothetical protein [Kibdelosporangium banguiense]MBP2320902.1 hypothetical protein [Kibdelosporangium banguiense]
MKSTLFTHYARAQLTGTGYRYELAFPHPGGIPADVRYRVRNRDLATVKATYHGGWGNGVKEHVAKSGDLVLDSYRYPAAVAIPGKQTEYYSAGV